MISPAVKKCVEKHIHRDVKIQYSMPIAAQMALQSLVTLWLYSFAQHFTLRFCWKTTKLAHVEALF
jgi:hypothetical protein